MSFAFDDGYQAYIDDIDLDDNPYEFDTDEYDEWEEGWLTAEEDHE